MLCIAKQAALKRNLTEDKQHWQSAGRTVYLKLKPECSKGKVTTTQDVQLKESLITFYQVYLTVCKHIMDSLDMRKEISRASEYVRCADGWMQLRHHC